MSLDIYKATATVGGDTIEAEYFSFENDIGFNELDLTLWDKITIPFWRIRRWVKDIYRKIRYGFQRMFKGYDNVDIFETFTKFVERYTKILAEYKKTHLSHATTMTNEEWEAIIDKMLYHLHYMDEDNVEQELEKDIPDSWSASPKTISEIMNRHKDEFFKLFSENFYDLWD